MQLMDEIRNAREKNKELSDEERRKNAESLMLRLAKMMDLGSDDEDYDPEV
jgi:hypothetical protein